MRIIVIIWIQHFKKKIGIPDSGNDLTLSGTQINFKSDSFISNSAGGNSGNHLVIFANWKMPHSLIKE